MSDEIGAVRRSAVTFQLTALQVPASRAAGMARSLRFTIDASRVVILMPAIYFFALAAMALWFAWLFGLPWNDTAWVAFWIAILAALVWVPLFGRALPQRESQAQLALYLHRGIQALRQAAADGDNRLAPVIQNSLAGTSASNAEISIAGRLQRVDARPRGIMLVVMGVVIVPLVALYFSGWPRNLSTFDGLSRVLWITISAVILIEGAWLIIVGIQWLRPFKIAADDQGIHWRQPALGLGWRTARAPWKDARAFVAFRASKDGKSGADMDEIFLLDATKYVVTWKITPRTPPDVRATHERFAQVVSARVQLRDITASLNKLLESPETRSYEYAISVLSDPGPILPDVRKTLFPPERMTSYFRRGYLIAAAILLTLLAVAGLLLQTGVIPPHAV
jgi:hypothetical protein